MFPDFTCQTALNAAVYAERLAEILHTLAKDHNIRFFATGISNEPNMTKVNMTSEEIPEVVKELRASLDFYEDLDPNDDLGLRRIQIIAPEASNSGSIDAISHGFITALVNDPQAMDDLDGFGVHS